MLAEEKSASEHLAAKRDLAEKDAREKEARVLVLLRDNEELKRLLKGEFYDQANNIQT
jgi:hypothetical protein